MPFLRRVSLRKIASLLRLFLLVNAIGIGVALAIWVYGLEIQAVNALRLQLANHLPRWFVLPMMGALGGGIAGGLISAVEPGAKGSGIVQVMLWLRGCRCPWAGGWRW